MLLFIFELLVYILYRRNAPIFPYLLSLEGGLICLTWPFLSIAASTASSITSNNVSVLILQDGHRVTSAYKNLHLGQIFPGFVKFLVMIERRLSMLASTRSSLTITSKVNGLSVPDTPVMVLQLPFSGAMVPLETGASWTRCLALSNCNSQPES